jgi:predicted dehydrogenase
MMSYRNILPGFGNPPDGPPPPELDWDTFLGPAPLRPYNPNRGLYHFRWFWDYSGGQMTNLGQHSLDLVDWFFGPLPLQAVASYGGRYALQDNGETPDTQDALFSFPNFTAVWSHREVSKGPPLTAYVEFCGTKGTLGLTRNGFVVTPDRQIDPASAIPQFTGAHPAGGPQRSAEEGPQRFWTTALKDESGSAGDQFVRHARNFVDCVKSRQTPISDLESGCRVATWCHLANLALRRGRPITWDTANGTVAGDAAAAKLLERPYRAPWDGVLQGLLKG